LYCEVRFNRLL